MLHRSLSFRLHPLDDFSFARIRKANQYSFSTGSVSILQAAFADTNIGKQRSGYYWFSNMLSREELWRHAHAAFEAHRIPPGDIDAQAALERVAKKCLGLDETKPFNANNSSIREEMMTAEMLDNLIVYHSRPTPQRDGGSLVILRYCGRNVVIDGNNRVNLWRAQKKTGPFHARVIVSNENAAYLFFQRRIYTIVAVGEFCLFTILFWVRGRDLLKWAMDAPISQLLFLQIFTSALSSILLVELLRTTIARCEQWNDRQHLRAVFYTWGVIFIVSSGMLAYSRLTMQPVVP